MNWSLLVIWWLLGFLALAFAHRAVMTIESDPMGRFLLSFLIVSLGPIALVTQWIYGRPPGSR